MKILEYIWNHKEWIFSGIGGTILVGIVYRFNRRSDFISLTVIGGLAGGSVHDKSIRIKKDLIHGIGPPGFGQIGKTRIVMADGTHYYVKESEAKISRKLKR